MKLKNTILLLILILLTNNIFALNNNQRIQHIDSDIYDGIRDLYLSQSLAMPSTAAPYSDAELLMMLDLLDTNKFSNADAKVYEYVKDSLKLDNQSTNDYGKINWDINFNLEGYIHSNTEDFIRRENFIYDFQDQKQLINIGFEAWTGENFYGLGNFSLAASYTTTTPFGSEILTHNILGLSPLAFGSNLDFNFPYRAFLAFGDDTWSLEIGRDRAKWGNGVSSNFMLGDNLPFLNELRYTTFSNQFKYTFLTAFFPHPENYLGDGDNDPTTGYSQKDIIDGTKAFIAHRGEGRFFNNKVSLALNESIMYQSDTNVLDLRYLSPTALFHNYYIRANANSLLSAEVDYTPLKNFNIYAQGVVDEFALPGEAVVGESDGAFPPAMGYLVGMRYHYDVLDKYKGNTSFEFAHTDPYLYLRGNGLNDSDQDPTDYGINYVVAFREFYLPDDAWYHNEFLGYEYGGDAIVFNLNSKVKNYGRWSLSANAFYMLHGTFDKFTLWNTIDTTDPINSYITPTSDYPANDTDPLNSDYLNDDPTNNEYTSDIRDRDSVSETLVLGASASYNINKNLSCFVQLDYININNYQNVSGEKASDVQLVLSMTYQI